MTDDALSLHLTEPNPQIGAFRRMTVPGMAHWAGSGPPSRSCRECKFWEENGYYAKSSFHGQTLKPGHCKQYSRMMQGTVGGRIPHETASCKYFEASDAPMPVVNPK